MSVSRLLCWLGLHRATPTDVPFVWKCAWCPYEWGGV